MPAVADAGAAGGLFWAARLPTAKNAIRTEMQVDVRLVDTSTD